MLKSNKTKSKLITQKIGGHPIINFYINKLRLNEIFDKYLPPGKNAKLSNGKTIQVIIHNIFTSPGALYRMKQWSEPIAAQALGLAEFEKEVINDDRLGGALDALSEFGGKGLFFQIALRAIKVFSIKTERMHHDTTTCTFSGEYNSSLPNGKTPHITRGFNKDHRHDLKQLVFGYSVSNDGAVPLLHKTYSGNQTDDTLHIENFKNICSLLETTNFTYVADSKLCTVKNLAHLNEAGAKFVTVLPRTRIEDQRFRKKIKNYPKKIKWHKILSLPNKRGDLKPLDIYYTCKGEYKSEDNYRIVWIKSSLKQKKDYYKRKKSIENSLEELNNLNLNRGKLKKKKNIKIICNNILRNHGTKEYIEIKILSTRIVEEKYSTVGRPGANSIKKLKTSTYYSLSTKVITKAVKSESYTDGVFPLITNHFKKSKVEILEIYKYQPYVEKRHELIKTEFILAPVYLKKPSRVVAMLDIYFIVMLIASLIEREIRTNMKNSNIKTVAVLPEGRPSEQPTTPRILEIFSNIQIAKLITENHSELFKPKLTEDQILVLKLLKIPVKYFHEQWEIEFEK